MTEVFFKVFRILNPDSEIAKIMGIEAPALVSPYISSRRWDGHKVPYGPLIYGIGRKTVAENYCPCNCDSGIGVQRYIQDFPRQCWQTVVALCEISGKRKKTFQDCFAVEEVRPYEILPLRCFTHADTELLSEGYLFPDKDTLQPTCGRCINPEHLRELTPYRFRIEGGEILFQKSWSWDNHVR